MIFIIVTDFGIILESENDNIFRASSCEVIQQQRLFHDMAYDYNNTVNKITLVPKKNKEKQVIIILFGTRTCYKLKVLLSEIKSVLDTYLTSVATQQQYYNNVHKYLFFW